MDKSKEYIKMSDCPEIQGIHEWQDGDFYSVFMQSLQSPKVFVWTDSEDVPYENLKPIFLPRQDQLQGMVKERFIGHWDGEYFNPSCFYVWYEQNHIYCISNFNSFEQLWLAFVMEEKYNKTWDGKEWK